MTWSRRSKLLLIVAALVGCDILFLVWLLNRNAAYARVTYVGMDSLSVIVPRSRKAAALLNDRRQPALEEAEITAEDMMRQKRQLSLITLGSHPTYGRFIASIRDLRASKKCNVLILEDGDSFEAQSSGTGASPSYVDIPALVLCVSSIGDAGFRGMLPL